MRKKLGEIGPAIGDFRRAFELNPRNLDAQREVRLYEMRAQKDEAKRQGDSKPPPKPSLIGRLFKK